MARICHHVERAPAFLGSRASQPLTKCDQRTDEGHGDGEVDVAVEEVGPDVGGAAAGTAARQEQAQLEARVAEERHGQSEPGLWSTVAT